MDPDEKKNEEKEETKETIEEWVGMIGEGVKKETKWGEEGVFEWILNKMTKSGHLINLFSVAWDNISCE